MPIDFICPHCGKRTNVPDEFAGQSGPCASCGQVITVPGKLSPAPKPPNLPTETGSRKWLLPLLIIAGSILPMIACGGILVALLLPAIQAAREAARRTQCNNNLKQMALGLQNYHDTYKTFPAGAMHAGRAGESERLGPSWYVGTLPFMEKSPVYDAILASQSPGAPGNGAFNAENISTYSGVSLDFVQPDYMKCPSSPLPAMETPPGPVMLPHYVGISGGCDLDPASPDYQVVNLQELNFSASGSPYRNRFKSVGHTPGSLITASGVLTACQYIGMASITDGTSNTIIMGEQSDWLRDRSNGPGRYHGDPGWDTNGTGPANPSLTDGGGFISGTVHSKRIPAAVNGTPGITPTPYDCYNITTVRYPVDLKQVLGNSPLPGCDEDHGINNPLQSPHPGGLQVAFTDGSVQFLAGPMDFAILLKIAIRDDGQTINMY